MGNMWKEFKEFAVKGNAIDLAVGVIIGAAFGGIITSLVKDILMPPIGLLTGGLDFSNKFIILKAGGDGMTNFSTPADALAHKAITWNYGNFITLIINFIIVALAVFLLVKAVNKMMALRKKQEKAEEAAKPDPQEKLIAAMDRLTATLEKKA